MSDILALENSFFQRSTYSARVWPRCHAITGLSSGVAQGGA